MHRTFTRAEAREYDRRCMEELGIPGIVLMENAAVGCARVARGMLGPLRTARVVVVCGPGQNGGDGYAIARLLRADRLDARVIAVGQPRPGTDAATMRSRAEAAGVHIEPFRPGASLPDSDLVVDALFGTGLDRPLAGDDLAAVRAINAASAPVLSVDLPSGMDCDSGNPLPECVRATETATMVAPKAGFRPAGAQGRVRVVEIGGPGAAGRDGPGR